MRDDYLEKTYARTAAKLGLIKERRYVDDPSEAPEGADVQQGERGGYYYETDGGSSGSGGGEAPSGSSGGGGGQQVTVGDMDNPEATVEMLADTIGENAAEYGNNAEAAYQDFVGRVRDGEDVAEALNSVMEGTTTEGLQEMLARDMGLPYDTGGDGSEGNETPVGNEEAGSPPEEARSQEELVAQYEDMSPEQRRERAEQYLETAQMAEEAGEDDLRALMMSRLQALDEVSDSGDAMSE